MNTALRADLFLVLVTLIWGATFPLVATSLGYINPFIFVLLRFSLAALVLLFWLLPVLRKTDRKVLWAGFILGLLNAGVYLLQTLGMRHVDADTSAFIASVGVVFVPFLAPLLGLSRVKKIEIFGSLICLGGLFVLTGASLSAFTLDEFWILLSALVWAGAVCYLQKVSPYIKDGRLLAFYQVIFVLPIALVLSVGTYQAPVFNAWVILSLLYTGIVATGIVFLIQVRYQKETTATHAAIIYSLEPLFASFVAIYLNHEPLTERIVIGGGIILLSICLIEVVPRIKFS